jgi:predicted RNA-binding Zn-ribbon protein involved in translation (DUF1610 family)
METLGSPESSQEKRSKYFESRKLQPELQEKIIKQINKYKLDRLPDVVTCPAQACGFPVDVNIDKELIKMHCLNCGWNTIIRRHKIKTPKP